MLRNFVLACLSLALCSSHLVAEELISWHEDVAAARQLSQQYKVPILIHFYGDQCMPCKTLEKNVFTRPEVASTIQRYFVPVRINATQDRRTAAEYGVHSWPTDVFVSPDGKTLTQGVCNQNPTAYLQNLQSVAIMNRDRNVMLTANTPADPSTSGASPYGRTANASLQQAAPGREQAPSPYSNPSSGAAPYAPRAVASGLTADAQSALPSPTWQGQSALGQAINGQVGAGPLPYGNAMTVHPSAPAMTQDHKDANVPPTVQWQTAGSSLHNNSAFAQSQPAASNAHLAGIAPHDPRKTALSPALASAPTMPPTSPVPGPGVLTFAGTTNGMQPSGRPVMGPVSGATVENPHFTSQQTANQHSASQHSATSIAPESNQFAESSAATGLPSAASAPRIPAQLASTTGTYGRSIVPIESRPTVSVPALSGYCPVALFANSQWIEGSPEMAIRHRGRVYFLSSEEAARKFLDSPDSFCPILSGYDPLVFLREGRLVEGSIYAGVLKDPQRLVLFSSEANKKFFHDNFDRLIAELEAILNPNKPLTAAAPAPIITR